MILMNFYVTDYARGQRIVFVDSGSVLSRSDRVRSTSISGDFRRILYACLTADSLWESLSLFFIFIKDG